MWNRFIRLIRNILDGMATLTIFPPPMPPLEFPKRLTDEEAIAKDWEMVGKDNRSLDI
jgi:hypothetical protein